MILSKRLDENLRAFATDRQWEVYEAYCRLGTQADAGLALGVTGQNVGQVLRALKHRAERGGYVIPTEMELYRQSTLSNADGQTTAEWNLRRLPATDPGDAFEMPEPKILKSVSTFTRGDGSVIAQWRKEDIDKQAQLALMEQFTSTLLERVPVREPVDQPLGFSHTDLLACYPVGDQHHGMAAWANEAGTNWDLDISNRMIRKASRHLIDQCPPCETAVYLFLGDFFHYDSYKPLTPGHANLLDADGRMPKMVDTGWLIVEHLINAGLERHQNVHVIWEAGNHDEALAPITRGMLRRLYRDNPRVTIDGSDAFWHYYQFGKVMIITNHGDKIKPQFQLGVAAHDQPVMWGETTCRHVYLGHRHHEETKEYPGGWVHTMPVLPPPDAYAHRGGYRNAQSQHAMVFHRDGRLQTRHLWYPDTVEAK